MEIWRVLGFCRSSMFVILLYCVDIAVHCPTTSARIVVPFDIDAGEFIACPVNGDVVVTAEGQKEMLGVFCVNIFYAKIIHNENKEYRLSFLSP
jgi:hypothetical protein